MIYTKFINFLEVKMMYFWNLLQIFHNIKIPAIYYGSQAF
jgi:hypothetical protein